jgi:hypothetical protein
VSIDVIIGDSMGLGPPVCENCKVLYTYKNSYGWECPICKINSENCLHLWSCGISDEELAANLKLWQFMNKIIDPGTNK